MGRIVELVESKDGKVRGAKVKIGKTNNVVKPPINLLYPLEANLRVRDIVVESDCSFRELRPKRDAAILGELKRKYVV